MTQLLEYGCDDISGVVLIDPVDGYTPFKISLQVEVFKKQF